MNNKCKDIFDVTIMVLGLVIASASCVFAYIQVQINKEQMILNAELQQPVFQLKFNDWRSIDSNIDNHTDVELFNNGEILHKIKHIGIDSYLEFGYSPTNSYKLSTIYVPLNSYFNYFLPTGEVNGKLAETYSLSYPNRALYVNLYDSTMVYMQNSEFVMVNLIHITSVQYIDKFNIEREKYFMGKDECPKEMVLDISNKAHEIFGEEKFEIGTLTISSLIQRIEAPNSIR